MFKFILVFFVLIACVLANKVNLCAPVWPLPMEYVSKGSLTPLVSQNLQLIMTCQESSKIRKAFNRFTTQTLGNHVVTPDTTVITDIYEMHVCVMRPDVPLGEVVDESYSISIDNNNIMMTCNMVFGCYHGFTTLGQLIEYEHKKRMFQVKQAPVDIIDKPRFPHRGLLIDTSRHWQPLKNIYGIVDALVLNKMNVLHWHLTDWQAFPYESKAFPQLADKGAYSQLERYNAEDIKNVVQYAEERGVRVVPEFDTPGHSYSMALGMPEIFPNGGCPKIVDYNWAFDFTKNRTYEVVEKLWSEFMDLFPSKLMHIGGDEVDSTCWKNNKEIVQWCKERNMTVNDGFLYYVKHVMEYLSSNHRDFAAWQEIWQHFGTKLPNSTIIHIWYVHDPKMAINITSHGYRLLWSDVYYWYLDELTTRDWRKMYDAEPCKGLKEKECKLVIGGETCMFGETVDGSDFFSTIFPRASAVAERLWSPASVRRVDKITKARLGAMRCHLLDHGITSSVMQMPARGEPPYPGSCYDQ